MVGEDGAAIDRRKERKFIAVLPERIFFFFFCSESSSVHGYVHLFVVHACMHRHRSSGNMQIKNNNMLFWKGVGTEVLSKCTHT